MVTLNISVSDEVLARMVEYKKRLGCKSWPAYLDQTSYDPEGIVIMEILKIEGKAPHALASSMTIATGDYIYKVLFTPDPNDAEKTQQSWTPIKVMRKD
jgi:hypothetical protein